MLDHDLDSVSEHKQAVLDKTCESGFFANDPSLYTALRNAYSSKKADRRMGNQGYIPLKAITDEDIVRFLLKPPDNKQLRDCTLDELTPTKKFFEIFEESLKKKTRPYDAACRELDAIFELFASETTPQSGPLYPNKDAMKKVFDKAKIRLRFATDPPGVSMYVAIGTTGKGLPKLRSTRGTQTTECYHGKSNNMVGAYTLKKRLARKIVRVGNSCWNWSRLNDSRGISKRAFWYTGHPYWWVSAKSTLMARLCDKRTLLPPKGKMPHNVIASMPVPDQATPENLGLLDAPPSISEVACRKRSAAQRVVHMQKKDTNKSSSVLQRSGRGRPVGAKDSYSRMARNEDKKKTRLEEMDMCRGQGIICPDGTIGRANARKKGRVKLPPRGARKHMPRSKLVATLLNPIADARVTAEHKKTVRLLKSMKMNHRKTLDRQKVNPSASAATVGAQAHAHGELGVALFAIVGGGNCLFGGVADGSYPSEVRVGCVPTVGQGQRERFVGGVAGCDKRCFGGVTAGCPLVPTRHSVCVPALHAMQRVCGVVDSVPGERQPSKSALAVLRLRCRGATEGARAWAGGTRFGWDQHRQTAVFLANAAHTDTVVCWLELRAAFYALRCATTRTIHNARNVRRGLSRTSLSCQQRVAEAKRKCVERAQALVSTVRELESMMLCWFPCTFVGHAASSGFSYKVAEVSLRAVADCSRMKALRSSRIARFSGSHMEDCVCEVEEPVEFRGPDRASQLEHFVGGVDKLVCARFMRHNELPVTFQGLSQVLGVDPSKLPSALSAARLGARLWPWEGDGAYARVLACADHVVAIWEGVNWQVPCMGEMHPWSRKRLAFLRWKEYRAAV